MEAQHSTSTIGDISVTMVIGALLRSGRTVFLPFGDHHRYDLLMEDDGVFKRVQCKTARYSRANGAIEFNGYTVNKGMKSRRYTADEIDVYGVYSPDLDKVFLVPIADAPGIKPTLRVEPTLNNQKTKIRWAFDYEVRRDNKPL